MTVASAAETGDDFSVESSSPLHGNHNRQIQNSLPADRSLSASSWVSLLGEQHRLLARASGLGLVASLLVAFLIPKRYDSNIRLMPPDNQSGSAFAALSGMAGKSGVGMSSLPEGLLGMRSTGALFVDILGSRTVQDAIVRRFDLRRVYGQRYWFEARQRLQESTEVSEDRKSEVITIRIRDRDPQRAAQMAQAYIEELDHVVAQVSTSSARRERIFIENRLVSVKQDLDRASEEFSWFASQNGTMDIASQARSALESAARLQGELIAAKAELEGVEQVYTANNVRVRTQQARVHELKKQLDQLNGDRAPGRKTSGQGAARQSSDGHEADGGGPSQPEALPSIRQIPLLGVRWQNLYRQAKMQETVFELLTQQYELAKIQEAKEIPTVKVLDEADIPEKKSFPPRLVIVMMGTLLTLSAAVFGVLGRASWKQIDSADPRKQLGQLLLSPLIGTWCRLSARMPRKARASAGGTNRTLSPRYEPKL